MRPVSGNRSRTESRFRPWRVAGRPGLRLIPFIIPFILVWFASAAAAGGRPAVVLVAASPAGAQQLDPLAQDLTVAGYTLRRLAPDDRLDALSRLSQALAQTMNDLGHLSEIGDVSLVAHGAGALAVLAYLRSGAPAGLKRVLLMAPPLAGLAPPSGGGPCGEAWRERVDGFYPPALRQSAADLLPGIRSGALRAAPRLGCLLGRMDSQTGPGCPPEPGWGDGVLTEPAARELPGLGREQRVYRTDGDHITLPARAGAREMVARFLSLPAQGGAAYACLLVIDGSGSVKRTDQGHLRDRAVRQLISRLEPGDQVGVVSFDTRAAVRLPLTTITGREQATGLARGLDKLPAKGDTDIGAGLRLAAQELGKAGPHHRKAVVLLSDGRNDPAAADGPTLEAARALARRGVTLHAVGLTDRVDRAFLSRLARMGGGLYRQVGHAGELAGAFDLIQAHLEGLALLASARGRVPADLEFLVDSTVAALNLNLEASGPVRLTLRGPAGDGRPPFVLQAEAGQQLVEHPRPGSWRVRVAGAAGVRFSLRISARTGLTVRPAPGWRAPVLGRPWRLVLLVSQDDLPVPQARARLLLKGPDGVERTLEAGGEGPDSFSPHQGQAGVISFTAPGWTEAGPVEVTALVEGYNRRGERFQRMLVHTTQAEEAPRAASGGGRP